MQAIKTEEKCSGITNGILGGTLSLTVSALIVKFLGLVYKIPIASLLGDLGMGYFNSAYTVYAFFYLLCTAGVPKAVMILISQAKAMGRVIEERKILSVAIRIFLTLGTIICLIFIIFSAPIARLIGNSRSAFTMISIAPSIVFVALSGVIRGYLNANMKLFDIAISQVIEGVGKLLLGLAFAMLGRAKNLPLEIISAMTIFGVTLGSFFGFAYLLICCKIKIKNEKAGQKSEKLQNKEIAKRIFAISIPITISAAIMSITGIIDLGLIMRSLTKIGYSEADASALYGNYTTLAVPMFNLAISIITPISVAHLPLFTKAVVGRDEFARGDAERSCLELTAIASAPMTFGLLVYSKEILGFLFPDSNLKVGSELLCMLTPAILFSSMLMVVNSILEAAGKLRSPMISMIFGSIAKLLVSYFAITKSSLGILGAPLGTVICYAMALLVSLILYDKTLKTRLPIFASSFAPYSSAFTAVFASRILYDRLFFLIDDRALLLLCILVAAVIYFCLLAFVGVLSPKKIHKMANYTKIAE